MERRRDEDLKTVEHRHADAVTALKKIHLEELQSVKDRMKDGAALEHLAAQIRHSSGSIKLIEEQLNVRYKGLDAAKEGNGQYPNFDF